MQVFDHLMIDIETLGKSNQAVITSIAAVQFNMGTGETGEEFHVHIDPSMQGTNKIDGSTVLWWLQQSQEARDRLVNGIKDHGVTLSDALFQLITFINNECIKDILVWARPPKFDLNIIENSLESYNIPIPWGYANSRCVRTLASFAPEIVKEFKATTIEHDALEDCYVQIKYCSKIWNRLKF